MAAPPPFGYAARPGTKGSSRIYLSGILLFLLLVVGGLHICGAEIGSPWLQSMQGGFFEDMFLRQPLPSYLCCPICKNILRDPVYVCVEGHNLCTPCLEEYARHQGSDRCPSCRGEMFSRAMPNLALRCVISDEKVVCPLALLRAAPERSIRCGWAGRLGEANSHTEQDCPLNPQPCVGNESGCSWSSQRGTLDEHERSCTFVHPRCPQCDSRSTGPNELCSGCRAVEEAAGTLKLGRVFELRQRAVQIKAGTYHSLDFSAWHGRLGDERHAWLLDDCLHQPSVRRILLTNFVSLGTEADSLEVQLRKSLRTAINVQTLDLSGCTIGPTVPLTDCLGAMRGLRTLILRGVNASSWGSLLGSGLHSAESLDLGSCGIGSLGVGDGSFPGLENLGGFLRSMTCLRKLYLDGNDIGNWGACLLSRVLRAMVNLRSLDLGQNNIGEAGIRYLADALKEMAGLQTLKLGRNLIGEEGANDLADALGALPGLQSLDLDECGLGDEGAIAIARAVSPMSSLRALRLGGNGIGDEGATALAGALKRMGRFQVLDLELNSIGDAGEQSLRALKKMGMEVRLAKQTCSIAYNSGGDDHSRHFDFPRGFSALCVPQSIRSSPLLRVSFGGTFNTTLAARFENSQACLGAIGASLARGLGSAERADSCSCGHGHDV